MPLSSHIKPEPNPPLDRARVMRAREMYEEGFTVSRILAHCGMSYGTLYACLDGAPSAASLVNRQLRTAERQVRDIETRLSAREQTPVERERDVRMLTGLTRALRDLQALQAESDGGRRPGRGRG